MDGPSDSLATPGQLIQQQLAARGWTQRMLSAVLNVGESSVTRLLNGKQPVDAALAVALEEALDVRAEQILGLQAANDLALARSANRQNNSARPIRAQLYASLPLRDMVRRRWIDAGDMRDTGRLDGALAAFFGVSRLEEIADCSSVSKGAVSLVRRAWLRRGYQLAAELRVAPYTRPAAVAALAELRSCMSTLESIERVPRILSACGIRLVIVETLAGADIDGACFWLDDRSPVIALSLREDRIDRFWFLLRHELEHVLQGTRCVEPHEDSDHIERDADAAALAFCVPLAALDSFIQRKAPFVSRRDLAAFARSHGLHPGIVVGLIQRRTGHCASAGAVTARVRTVLSTCTPIDGWGLRSPAATGPAALAGVRQVRQAENPL